MTTDTQQDARVAEVRLVDRDDDFVHVTMDRTSYRVQLLLQGELEATIGRRIHGIIRVNVWKVDFVSPGGAYIEPVLGRPRRVQGRVVAHQDDRNGIVISVSGCPITADLPERWQKVDVPIGTLVAVDVYEGAVFEVA